MDDLFYEAQQKLGIVELSRMARGYMLYTPDQADPLDGARILDLDEEGQIEGIPREGAIWL